MATAADILNYLIPNGGWAIQGEDFDSIVYDEGIKPVTKKQFDDALAIVTQTKAEQAVARSQARTELLTRLGITADEAALLLS
jgi:hypothetical protein